MMIATWMSTSYSGASNLWVVDQRDSFVVCGVFSFLQLYDCLTEKLGAFCCISWTNTLCLDKKLGGKGREGKGRGGEGMGKNDKKSFPYLFKRVRNLVQKRGNGYSWG